MDNFFDDFDTRIRKIANLLAYDQDVSSYDPLEVAAARIYLKDQTDETPTAYDSFPPPSDGVR